MRRYVVGNTSVASVIHNPEIDKKLSALSFALKDNTRRAILYLLRRNKMMTLTDVIKSLGYDKSKKALIYYHIKILEQSGLISPTKIERSGMAIRRKYYGLTLFSQMIIDYLTNRKVALSDDPISPILLRILKGNRKLYNLCIKLSILSSASYLITFILRTLYLILFKGVSYAVLSLPCLLFIVHSAFIPPLLVIAFFALYVRIRQ